MTRDQFKIESINNKELRILYARNYKAAFKFFSPLIEQMKKDRPGVRVVLHHIELEDQNYELWDTVVPLYTDEHQQLHGNTDKVRKQRSDRMKRLHAEGFKPALGWHPTEEQRKEMSKRASVAITKWWAERKRRVASSPCTK